MACKAVRDKVRRNLRGTSRRGQRRSWNFISGMPRARSQRETRARAREDSLDFCTLSARRDSSLRAHRDLN